MHLCERSIIATLVVTLVSISGAYAYSMGGGASVSSSDNGYAEGIFASTANSAVSQASFTGADVNYNNWLDDTTGKHVEETLKVVQGSGNYKCEFKKGTTIVNPDSVNHLVPASSSLTASQLLTVTSAKEIHAGAKARNGKGDQASVGVDVIVGSITGYKNTATATATNAVASQSATSASGSFIQFITQSNNKKLDNVSPSLEVHEGSVSGYASSGTATATNAVASQSAKSASGSFIQFITQSNNKKLDNVSPSLEVHEGSVSGYASSGTATATNAVASQSAKSASGSFIQFMTISDNIKPGNVSPSLTVVDGSVKSYSSSGTATITSTTASQRAKSASGSSVVWDNL